MTLPQVISLPSDADAARRGDVRGTYGYGRSAHGSDPGATYHFRPGPDGPSRTQEYFDDIAKQLVRDKGPVGAKK